MATDLPSIAKQIRTLQRSDTKAWLRTGELLTEAQGLCSGDRDFAKWLRSVEMPRATAYRAMNVWRVFGECPAAERFTREALHLLSKCEPARNAAIAMAGEKIITPKIARELLKTYDLPTLTEHMANRDDAGDLTRVVIVEGCKVTFRFSSSPTTADILGALAAASRQLQDQLRYRPAA